MPPRPAALPEGLPVAPFRAEEALALGVSRRQLAGPGFVRLFRGVYAPASTAADPAVRRQGALLLAPHATLSHVSGAEHWDLPLPPALLRDLVHIAVAYGTAQPRVRGVVAHELRLDDTEIVVHEGVRVTTVERTITDLAPWLCLADLVAVMDAALHRGLTTRDALWREADTDRARRGVRAFRRAVELADGHSESRRESILRVVVICAGLPAPEVNIDIFDDDGRWICRGDLPYPEWKTLLEYDGAQHLEDRQRQRDLLRTNDLLRAGWVRLGYGSQQMRLPDAVTGEVWDVLRSRGWNAPGPRPRRLERGVLHPPRRPR